MIFHTNLLRIKWSSIFLILIFFSVGKVHANIVKLALEGVNNCNGQLDVELYIKASDLGDNTTFSIGSSSIFLNFKNSVVTYSSYQPAEFSASTSGQAAGANWIDQSWHADNMHGLLNIILQKEPGGTNDYLLDKTTWVHIGTLTFDWIGPQVDPEIKVHDKFSMFNLPANDGLGLHIMEDYPYAVIQGHSGSASTQRACFSDGEIIVTFPDLSNRTDVNISIDGGLTFPYTTPDDVGSYTVQNVPAGTYDVWLQWNTGCAISIGSYTVLQWELPRVTTSFIGDVCDSDPNATQILTFFFANSNQRTNIEFSIDGGLTYPYYYSDTIGSADIVLTPGAYDLWVRWGNNQCPIDLPDVSFTIADPPTVSNISTAGGCNNNGSIVISFPDDPNQTNIEFSIDGGLTFPYSSPDNAGFIYIDNLMVGKYDLWVRWGDASCWVDLSVIAIGGSVSDVRIKAFLEGALDNSSLLMADDLRVQNLIPTTEPYTALGYTHVNGNSGAQVANPQKVFGVTGQDAIVDWVFVKFHDPTTITPTGITLSKSLLIQRDGDIVELDGVTPFRLNSFAVCDASVSVYHRNHLGIKTMKGGIQFATNTQGETILDLTNNSTVLEGFDPASVVGGVQSIWAADATNDAIISATDRSDIWNDRNIVGYFLTDVNLDGVVNAADRSFCWNNRNKFGIAK